MRLFLVLILTVTVSCTKKAPESKNEVTRSEYSADFNKFAGVYAVEMPARTDSPFYRAKGFIITASKKNHLAVNFYEHVDKSITPDRKPIAGQENESSVYSVHQSNYSTETVDGKIKLTFTKSSCPDNTINPLSNLIDSEIKVELASDGIYELTNLSSGTKLALKELGKNEIDFFANQANMKQAVCN